MEVQEIIRCTGTQIYLLSENGTEHSCLWEAPPECDGSDNMIENCGFEDQHVLGVPDNWLLTMGQYSLDPSSSSE